MWIFRASRKLPDGTIIYARDYGKKAFRIWIGPKQKTSSPEQASLFN